MSRSASSAGKAKGSADLPPAPASPFRSDTFLRTLLWLLIAYSFAMWIIALLDWLQHPLAESPDNAFGGHAAFRTFALFVGAPLVAALGGVIIRKQRQNVVGLLLLSWAGVFASYGISVEMDPTLFGLVSLPIAAWWMSLILTPFYFPDGRAYPARLSPFLPSILALGLVTGAAIVMGPATIPELSGSPANPFFVPGAQAASDFLLSALFLLMLPVTLGVFVSPLLRFRRASAKQRQQIRWFAWWSAIVFVPYLVFYIVMTTSYAETSAAPPLLVWLLEALIGLIGLFPPIIIAFSMLRYQLYDIQVIIRKTLLYAVLSAMLALVYFGSVILLQSLVSPVAGSRSPLVIVISTLLIAALFSPLRQRVQSFIDRRFYRRKYSAEQMLAGFAQTTRSEVDLDELTAALLQVVEQTVQPATVSVWLREEEAGQSVSR